MVDVCQQLGPVLLAGSLVTWLLSIEVEFEIDTFGFFSFRSHEQPILIFFFQRLKNVFVRFQRNRLFSKEKDVFFLNLCSKQSFVQ